MDLELSDLLPEYLVGFSLLESGLCQKFSQYYILDIFSDWLRASSLSVSRMQRSFGFVLKSGLVCYSLCSDSMHLSPLTSTKKKLLPVASPSAFCRHNRAADEMTAALNSRHSCCAFRELPKQERYAAVQGLSYILVHQDLPLSVGPPGHARLCSR